MARRPLNPRDASRHAIAVRHGFGLADGGRHLRAAQVMRVTTASEGSSRARARRAKDQRTAGSAIQRDRSSWTSKGPFCRDLQGASPASCWICGMLVPLRGTACGAWQSSTELTTEPDVETPASAAPTLEPPDVPQCERARPSETPGLAFLSAARPAPAPSPRPGPGGAWLLSTGLTGNFGWADQSGLVAH